LKNITITHEVAQKIREAIREGKFAPGSKLPSERELAGIMSVSRASIREGLRMLKAVGIVEARRGHGTFVASDLNFIDQSLTFDMFVAKKKEIILDLFAVRIVLESNIAAWTAEYATERELDELEDILSEMEAAIGRGETGALQDILFHDRIARACRNRVIQRIMSAIWELLRESREYTLKEPGRSNISLAAHRKILDAIRKHDPEGAKELMRQHLEEALEALQQRGI
jgi:GntR family transcriptional repressor for pyruvate dehydrogenase complex